MKKLSLISAGLVILSIFTIVACNQNDLSKVNEKTVYRSGKTFNYVDRELDSAMLFLEEVANHDEGNAQHDFTDLILDSVSYSLTVDTTFVNGNIGITGTEQERIKDTIIARTQNYPSRVDTSSFNDHDLIFVDVTNWNLNGTSLSFSGNIGLGDFDDDYKLADCTDPEPYGSNDYWEWGMNNGGCKTNTTTGSSAGNQMEKRLNYIRSANCVLNPCVNNGYPYFTDIRVVDEIAENHPSDPDPTGATDGYRDYLLFNNGGNLRDCTSQNPVDCTCLSPTEMEYHTDGAMTIAFMSDVKPTTAHLPISFEIEPDLRPGSGSNPLFHTAYITYAVVKCD